MVKEINIFKDRNVDFSDNISVLFCFVFVQRRILRAII